MLLLNVIVAVGAIGDPREVSVTVAMHVVGALTGSDAGAQLTAVEVVR